MRIVTVTTDVFVILALWKRIMSFAISKKTG